MKAFMYLLVVLTGYTPRAFQVRLNNIKVIEPDITKIDFRKKPKGHLTINKVKLDRNTTLIEFERRFKGHYQEASRGTDMDLWKVLFLDTFPRSKHQWMLYFDGKTGILKTINFIRN